MAPFTEGIHDNVFKCSCTEQFLLSTHNPCDGHMNGSSATLGLPVLSQEGGKANADRSAWTQCALLIQLLKTMRFLYHKICLIQYFLNIIEPKKHTLGKGSQLKKDPNNLQHSRLWPLEPLPGNAFHGLSQN